MSNEIYKLDDTVITNIAKIIQIAILTGTDVVDNLRLLSLTPCPNEEKLILDPNYEKSFENNIKSLLESISEINKNDED